MIYDKRTRQYFRAIYTMLKPGAIFEITDHRGAEFLPQYPNCSDGYVNQSHLLMMAAKAGLNY